MPKVVFYTPSEKGGHARYSFELIRAMTRQASPDWKFSLVTSLGLDERYRVGSCEVKESLSAIKPYDCFNSKLGWAANRMRHYYTREKGGLRDVLSLTPDVVHVQEINNLFAPYFYRRLHRAGVKVVRTIHNIMPHRYVLPVRLTHYLDRREWRHADRLVVHSEQLKVQIRQHCLGLDVPVHVTPHGVWSDFVSRDLCGSHSKKVLFFGNIRSNKGLDLLLDALIEKRDFSLSIAGRINETDYYERAIVPRLTRAKLLGLDVETRIGFIPDREVGELFSECDLIALPYRDFHAMSGILYDAIAYRIPIVATDVGGLSDVLNEFSIGKTFDGTVGGLSDAMVAVFEMSEIDLSRAFDNAQRKYSWDNTARLSLSMYERLL